MISKFFNRVLISLAVGIAPLQAMEPIDEAEMDAVSGQGGLALSGDFEINTYGGPLWDEHNNSGQLTTCDANNGNQGKCGARFAVKAGSSEGWFVLDDIRGGISFGEGIGGEPLRIFTDTRENSDGDDQEVLVLSVADRLRYNNVNMAVGTATHDSYQTAVNQGEGNSYNQTVVFSMNIDGDVTGRGNVLLFPTSSPTN